MEGLAYQAVVDPAHQVAVDPACQGVGDLACQEAADLANPSAAGPRVDWDLAGTAPSTLQVLLPMAGVEAVSYRDAEVGWRAATGMGRAFVASESVA